MNVNFECLEKIPEIYNLLLLLQNEVKNKVDWISDFSGGAGAIRQWVEKILQSQNKWQEQVEYYLQK